MLCLGTVLLWLRSHWAEEQLLLTGPGSSYCRLISSGQRWGGASLVLVAGVGWPAWGHAPFHSVARDWSALPAEFCYYVDHPGYNRPVVYERGTGGICFGPDGNAWSYEWSELNRGPANVKPKYVQVSYCRIEVSHWVAIVLFGIPPLAWLAFHLRRARCERWRLRSGLCLECGYDLRASKERCPECGTAIPAEQVAEGTGVEKKDL